MNHEFCYFLTILTSPIMNRIIRVLTLLLMMNNCFAQQVRKENEHYKIEPCTSTIGIATKDNLSALWNFETESLIGEFDPALFQLMYDLGPEEHPINDRTPMILSGAFGVELIDETATIVDYKNTTPRGMIPLMDQFGKDSSYFDASSGIEYFAYPKPNKAYRGYWNGGVRNRINKNWVIEPSAKRIVKGHSTFVAERIEYTFDSMNENHIYRYNIYDHQGKLLIQDLSESELLNTPKYLNLLVPKYKADSILRASEIRTLQFCNDYSFVTDAKTGRFRLLTNEIIQKPVDFLQWSSPIDEKVNTILENDTITFLIMDRTESYPINEEDRYEFYSMIGGRTASLTLRVKTTVFDSVFTYQFKYSNVIDTVIKEDFQSSNLSLALDPSHGNTVVRLNQLWQYSIERVGRDLLVVTNNRAMFFGAEECFRSGVVSLTSHKWILEPIYHSIIEFESGFEAYLHSPNQKSGKVKTYNFKGELIRP